MLEKNGLITGLPPEAAAQVNAGSKLISVSSGRWAGEQLKRAMEEGRPISPQVLREAGTLRKNEWEFLDEALVEEGLSRLRGVADLLAAGLTKPVTGAMGKTMFQWETITNLTGASVSLSGVDRTENETPEFELESIPLPITHRDFDLDLRHLEASRNTGESLDTTKARMAARAVAEKQESMLFQGGPVFGGKAIYGYLTHPDRITSVHFETTHHQWSTAGKTGAEVLVDIQAALAALRAKKFYGPFWIYVPSDVEGLLDDDFKANSDLTIRQRILQLNSIARIEVADQLTTGHVIFVQATQDVVAMVTGEPLQTVQWDIEGGFIMKFKAFMIQVPLIRSTASNACGVLDMTHV